MKATPIKSFIKLPNLIKFGSFLVLLTWFWLSLPQPIFNTPYSSLLFDRNNHLLTAKIAPDGQWRFPASDNIPYKYEQALLHFEDQYFYYHPGVNPFSIGRALVQNISDNRIVSGGSTITQQLIRMSRNGKQRNLYQKLIEFILSIRLEFSYSKEEILNLYASHAPFGGNVVGLETAAWRYYGRPSNKLSWGETATLAVLPNAPSLIYPGRNHSILLAKRNRLLNKLAKNNIIDSLTCELAKCEELPQKPKALPQLAPHLLTRAINDGQQGKSIQTSLDIHIQKSCNRIIAQHYSRLRENQIQNAAALIIDVKSGKVLAYVGNTPGEDINSGHQVDLITCNRSSGSILKPLLYSLMIKESQLLPHTLLADIPTQISGYAPKNFNKKHDGAVKASDALARSLNIPAVLMLQKYGVEKFLNKLRELGFTSVNRSADNYGLSLILGGAEVNLWELGSVYSSLSRSLQFYTNGSSEYSKDLYFPASYKSSFSYNIQNKSFNDMMGAAPLYHAFEALKEMDRPIDGINWSLYNSSRKIAWKTGTSFGHRDAWSVGITPEYVVAVWVGNADGEGRPGLTGGAAAAPILFDIFKSLPAGTWFQKPYDDMLKVAVCRKSGYKASFNCSEIDSLDIAVAGERTNACPYCKKINLDKTGQYRVNADCYRVSDMIQKSYMVLPPAMEWYYQRKNPLYQSRPPYLEGCMSQDNENIDIIYPKNNTRLFIPKNFGGLLERSIFQAAHSIPEATIYWHIDNEYLGSTNDVHEKEISVGLGKHTLTLIDDKGEVLTRTFEVLMSEK